MKIKEISKGSLQMIHLILIDMIDDKSSNTLENCLDMIEEQVVMIRVLEDLPRKAPIRIGWISAVQM